MGGHLGEGFSVSCLILQGQICNSITLHISDFPYENQLMSQGTKALTVFMVSAFPFFLTFNLSIMIEREKYEPRALRKTFPGDLQKHMKNCHSKTSVVGYRHNTEMKFTFQLISLQ